MTKYPEQEPTYYGQGITEDIRNGIFSRQLGKKAYELKDHLGNVRVTFSDIKMPTGSVSQPFVVDLLSKSEYFPYGMKINELSYNQTGARYGYNGTHEQELAINPDGNHLDFGNFGYDTRVAMRRNIDPMFASYPHLSGYATFNNNPIYFNDPTGYEPNDGAVVYADKYVEPEASGGSDLGTEIVNGIKSAVNTFVAVGKQLAKDATDNGNGKFLGATKEQWANDALSITPVVGSFNNAQNSYNNGDYLGWVGWTTMSAAELTTFGLAYEIRMSAFGAKTLAANSSLKVATSEVVETVLEGPVKSNYSRFIKKIPANSKDNVSFNLLDDGNYIFQAISPGKVTGSKAIYQKWVNPKGETFKMLKTTYAPDGSIIHVKPKF